MNDFHWWVKRIRRWLVYTCYFILRYIKYFALLILKGRYFAKSWRITTKHSYFNYSYYSDTYKDLLDQSHNPYFHFISRGWDMGCTPSPTIDPVAMILLRDSTIMSRSEQYQRILADNPYIYTGFKFHVDALPSLARKKEVADNVESLDYQSVILTVREKSYQLQNHPISKLIDAMDKRIPKVMVRLPHGFWDIASAIQTLSLSMQMNCLNNTGLSYMAYSRLAVRLFGSLERWKSMGLIKGDMFFSIYNQLDAGQREIDIGISFKGFPTYDNQPFMDRNKVVGHPTNELLLFSHFFSDQQYLYDATLPKRWALTGEFKNFPKAIANHFVILVAPDYFDELVESWDITLSHLVIERENSHQVRHDILDKIIEKLVGQTSINNCIVLTQCGASLSFWLGVELHKQFPAITYLDFGQALDVWCPSLKKDNWMSIYAETLAAHDYNE